ncbi:MAG: hypothetical protein ACP5D2_00240 [Candidatus Nanoarchaeia archaeon]
MTLKTHIRKSELIAIAEQEDNWERVGSINVDGKQVRCDCAEVDGVYILRGIGDGKTKYVTASLPENLGAYNSLTNKFRI